MIYIEDFLCLLNKVKKIKRDEWIACCPAHADKTPSLHVTLDGDTVLVHCHAGCSAERVMEAVGMTVKDLFITTVETPSKNYDTPNGLTLEEYSASKKLDIDFLTYIGLKDHMYYDTKSVKMPYYDESGGVAFNRYRLGMSGKSFRKDKNKNTCLYGLWRLDDIISSNYVVLCEGESDCHTLWQHDISAIGLPGASNWVEDRDAKLFRDIPSVYVLIEPDQGGQTIMEWLGRSELITRASLVMMEEYEDPSNAYIMDPGKFKDTMRKLVSGAVPALKSKELIDVAPKSVGAILRDCVVKKRKAKR